VKTRFSLININKKLQTLAEFLNCKGILLKSEEHLYAYPEELNNLFIEKAVSEKSIDLSKLIETHPDHHSIPLKNGNITIISPVQPLDESMVILFGEELLEEIRMDSIFNTILEANMAISSNLNLNTLLHIIMSLLEEIINPEVSAVMLLGPDKKELYWEVSRGEGSHFFTETLRLPVGVGIGGHVAQTGESVIVNDVRQDPRWDRTKDLGSGFTTKSMICVPLKFHGELLGVIEVINKKEYFFTNKDLRIIEIIATQSASAIENAKIYGELEKAYEELKILDKAKERIINHLSHELKTPLAVISSSLDMLYKRIEGSDRDRFQKTISRAQRNLDRLIELQRKIDDILNERPIEQKEKIIHLIETTSSLLEELDEESHEKLSEIIELISKRLESIIGSIELESEKILLDQFLTELANESIKKIPDRILNISTNLEQGLEIHADKEMLKKVCGGLLKNAIENTPDEGEITIKSAKEKEGIKIEISDSGVGITTENQKMIFGGFFHTQETGLYSSKSPYQFNAGGSGTDLLRIKIFSERFGFSIDFESTRCKFIPEDTDQCAGEISSCPHISNIKECLSSGGSRFSILLPTT